jgi:hypothetical protein
MSAQRLALAEEEVKRAQETLASFKRALGDPKLTAWVADRGRVAPRALSTFEMATVKRIAAIEQEIVKLISRYESILADIVCQVARKQGEGIDDPEVLLRAAMFCLAKANRSGYGTDESKAVVTALMRYVKSLEQD